MCLLEQMAFTTKTLESEVGAHPHYSGQQDGGGEKKYEQRHGQHLDRSYDATSRVPSPRSFVNQDRTDTPRASSPAPAPHLEMTFTACVNGTFRGCTRSRGRMNSAPAAGVGTDGTRTV